MTDGGQPGGPASTSMVSVDEHLADVAATVRPLAPIELALAEAEGCALASDVTARYPLPSFDNSAMDGYAVRAADITDVPACLPVTGEVAAGDTGAYGVAPGQAIRIMTGAQLPAGADTVVPVEWTDGGTTKVLIRQPAEPGNAIRRSGDDAHAGDVLLTAGTLLGPPQIGLAAAAGLAAVLVRPRPRAVIISTGNELAEPGAPLVPGKIWESNSFMLAAAARQAGCTAYRVASVPDDPHALLEAIEDQFLRADLVLIDGDPLNDIRAKGHITEASSDCWPGGLGGGWPCRRGSTALWRRTPPRWACRGCAPGLRPVPGP